VHCLRHLNRINPGVRSRVKGKLIWWALDQTGIVSS
jgi:hypothetical protein